MKEKFKAFFTTNLWLKLGALVAGLVLWGFLSNIQDPTVTKTVSIPVTYINEDLLKTNDGLVFLSGPKTTDVEVTIRTSRSSELKASMFECKADLTMRTGGSPENQSVRIEIEQVGGEGLILDWKYLRNDPYVIVSLDRYVSKDFPVEMLWTDKNNDLQPEQVLFNPSVVTIYGPSTKFSNLAAVKVPLSLSDITEGGEIKLDVGIKLYDLNGAELANMADFGLNPEKVAMTARIANVKKVPLETEGRPSGTVKDGVSFVSATTEKKEITLFSLSPIEINKLTVPLSDLNITGLSERKTLKLDLSNYMPAGVYTSDSERILSVLVDVEAHETRTFDLKKVEITGKNSDYEYVLLKIPQVSCTADKAVLSALSENSFAPTLNAEGLTPGKHIVQVSVKRPENTLVSETGLTVELEITEKGKTPESSEEPSSES